MRSMFLNKLKFAVLAVLLFAITAGVGGLTLRVLAGAGPGPDGSASPREPEVTTAKATDKNADRLDGRRWEGVSAEVDGVTCRGSFQPGVPPPSYWDLKDGGCVNAQKARDEKYPNE